MPLSRSYTPQKKETNMPNITLSGPRIDDLDKKRELVRSLTGAAARAYGLPEQTIVVVIQENAPENVSVGGQLVSDRPSA
jgi:4-oxalocrotonate tautomerase